MGLAILWVVLFHFPGSIPVFAFDKIKDIGYGGVDIFIFASGLGCYYSLHRDENFLSFLWRRIYRIYPMYLIFILVWLLWKSSYNPVSISEVVGNIVPVLYFSGNGLYFNWYISAIFLFYFFAPFLYQYLQHPFAVKKCCYLVILSVIVSFAFWHDFNYLIIFTRIPLFVMGMYFAMFCSTNDCISRKTLLVLYAVSIIGVVFLLICGMFFSEYLGEFGLYWYPFILITPGLCLAISELCSMMEHFSFVSKLIEIFGKLGSSSFAIYLTHIFIFDLASYVGLRHFFPNRALYALFLVVFIAVASVVLTFAEKKILIILGKKRKTK